MIVSSKSVFAFVFLLLLPLGSVLGQKSPNFYGKINVEYTQLSQEDRFNRRSNAGAYNVRNSESRLGAKGVYNLESFDVGYRAEVGLDSTMSDPTIGDQMSGRIRIRQAYASLKNQWGKLLLGQTYTATANMTTDLDPLYDTSVGLKADSQAEYISNIDSDLGYQYRSRKDLIGYTSPNLAGLSWEITVDRNDGNDVDNSAERGDTYIENLLSYKRPFGENELALHLGHIKWSSASSDDEKVWMAGTKLDLKAGFGLSFIYTQENEDQAISGANTTAEKDITRYMGAVSYQWHKHLVALTYGNRDQEDALRDGSGTNMTDNDKFSNNQLALGYKYNASKNVQLKLVGAQIKHEEEDTTLAQTSDNDATLLASGLRVKF